MFTNHNMNQLIHTTPSISNVVPLVIFNSRMRFVHVSLNSLINNNNHHPYKSSNLSKTIHNLRTKRTMFQETIATKGPDTIINNRKPRILCLHGFRTSGEIFKTQLKKWPESVLEKIEFIFPDGPFPSNGKSEVEGIFDPPYYEWFQFNKVRLKCLFCVFFLNYFNFYRVLLV